MNIIEKNIRNLCSKENISITELSEKIGMSFSGLYSSLRNDTLKAKTLQKIADILKVSPAAFFDEGINSTFKTEPLDNELVTMLSNRYDSYLEKINTLKDYYIWKYVRAIIDMNRNSPGKDIILPFPVQYKEGPELLLTPQQAEQIALIISPEDLTIPYSKWPDSRQGLVKSTRMLEGFYFIMFKDNIFQITNLMTDGLLTEPEIKKYWDKWSMVRNFAK